MISYIGGEIGPASVGFFDRAVYVIPVFGGAKQRLLARFPIFGELALWWRQGAVIDQAFRIEIFEGGFDLASAVKGFFGEEFVHLHAKRGEIRADQVHHHFGGKEADIRQPVGFGLIQQAVAILCLERFTNGNQVISGVETFGNFGAEPVGLAVTLEGGAGQHINLCATVIDVVFTRYIVTGEVKQRAQCIAKNRAAGVAHMQRAGRVGRDKLNINLPPCPDIGTAKACTGSKDVSQQPLPDGGVQANVQKAGAGHVSCKNARVC